MTLDVINRPVDLIRAEYSPLTRRGKRNRLIERYIATVYLGEGREMKIETYDEHVALLIGCGYKMSAITEEEPVTVKLSRDTHGHTRMTEVWDRVAGTFYSLEEHQAILRKQLYGV